MCEVLLTLRTLARVKMERKQNSCNATESLTKTTSILLKCSRAGWVREVLKHEVTEIKAALICPEKKTPNMNH